MIPAMEIPAIGLFDETWRVVARLGNDLTDVQWDLPTDCPGWTVKDQVAHMAGTEHTLNGDPMPGEPRRAPHVRNDLGAFNEAWVEHYRSIPGPEVLNDFVQIMKIRSETIRGFDDAQLNADVMSPVGVIPMRRFLEIRALDCFAHEQDIRRAVGQPGHLDGSVAAFAVTAGLQMLPKAVAKTAGAPDGTVVKIFIEGPAGQGNGVRVEAGRGTLLGYEPDHPDVAIDIDVEAFLLLGWGRWSADRVFAEARAGIEGDVALGRAILGSLVFVM